MNCPALPYAFIWARALPKGLTARETWKAHNQSDLIVVVDETVFYRDKASYDNQTIVIK